MLDSNMFKENIIIVKNLVCFDGKFFCVMAQAEIFRD